MKETLAKLNQDIKQIKENIGQAVKDLKTIEKALAKGDLLGLGTIIHGNRLENALKSLGLDSSFQEISDKYQRQMAGLRMDFDNKFVLACNELGLEGIKGNSMNEFHLKGILRLKINFQKNISEIKTFIRSKKLKSLDPTVIGREFKRETDRLFGREFNPDLFLKNLYNAYKILRSESKNIALLKDVHRVLWMEKQKVGFFETSDPKKITSYALDEFSVDLSRLMDSKVQSLENQIFCKISLGSGGINIYEADGQFNAYKFLEFTEGG